MSSAAERVAASQWKPRFMDVQQCVAFVCGGRAPRRSMIDMDIFCWKFQPF
jgi:hypothetical protein